MNILLIIQARIGSTRLPKKVLYPLHHETVLTYNVNRCKKIKNVQQVIIATSDLPQDDAIVEWCKQNNMIVCRGSENNVLERYVQCAEPYQPDYIMRVTSDCPFVDYEMASELVEYVSHLDEPFDIVDLEGDLPRGLAVELISYSALQRIHEVATEERHLEHVTYYAYEYPEQFKRVTYKVPSNRRFPEYRITLDTEEDYQMLQNVANHFQDPLISSVSVIQYLKDNPDVAAINAHIEQKPVQ